MWDEHRYRLVTGVREHAPMRDDDSYLVWYRGISRRFLTLPLEGEPIHFRPSTAMMNEMVRLVVGVHDRYQREINSQAPIVQDTRRSSTYRCIECVYWGWVISSACQPFQCPSVLGGHLDSKGHQRLSARMARKTIRRMLPRKRRGSLTKSHHQGLTRKQACWMRASAPHTSPDDAVVGHARWQVGLHADCRESRFRSL